MIPVDAIDENKLTYDSCFTFDNLMEAARKCYKGVSWKNQPQRFMNSRLTSVYKLYIELRQRTWKPQKVPSFNIIERGKPRRVKSVAYKDRVAQRCFCDNVLIPLIEKEIIKDTSACIKGRGLDYAYDRLASYLLNAPVDAWIIQYDFSSYFSSINQDKLLNQLRHIIKDDELFRFISIVVHDDKCGLELGNHVSQICAVLYPTALDRAIQKVPGCIGYHRYMDDGIIICTKDSAAQIMHTLEQEASKLDLKLNKDKTTLNKVTKSFSFCKMRFTKKPNRIKRNLMKRQTKRTCRHIRKVADKSEYYGIDIIPVEASCRGYVNRGDADLTHIIERSIDASSLRQTE
jgi:retron-type reverse transcriptase